jgi:sugar (pentulose or hexulose) kinase
LLLSPGALVDQWVLESNAGPTGGVVGQLAPLTAVSGEQLEAGLVSRGFVIEDRIDAPLTVLTGNPCFGPVGWANTLAPTVIGLRGTNSGKDVLAAAIAGSCYAVRSMLSCLQEGYGEQPAFVVATGGMSTSAPWCQLLADVTGHQVRVRPLSKVTGLAGAALVAGDETVASVDDDDVLIYEQTAAGTSGHREGHARYEQLYKTLQRDYDAEPAGDARTR